MVFPARQHSAFIAALLLFVQVLGLGHLAFARHSLGETGALVEVVPHAAAHVERHTERAPHVCAADLAIHADAAEACMVVAVRTSPSMDTPRFALAQTAHSAWKSSAPLTVAAAQLDALSRAPKASPPQG